MASLDDEGRIVFPWFAATRWEAINYDHEEERRLEEERACGGASA